MKILSIETSCDDTGISIVEFVDKQITILSNIVNTQTIHSGYGGVFPAMAKREHIKNIPDVYAEACEMAKVSKDDPKIDAIAVTVGPGLEPSLWVGITFAIELSKKLNVPIIPVNHMEGHLLSSLLPNYEFNKKINLRDLPEHAISLLVSGGHTQLITIENSKYKIIGTTVDDAVGEAFDKVARMLGLTYPGGPAVSKLAEQGRILPKQNSSPTFPRPMLHSKDFNLSFSGLKTAILYFIRDNPIKNEDDKIAIAKEFEDAAIEVIVKKTIRAISETGSTHLLLGGGVAANKYLQSELEIAGKENNFEIYYPVKEITSDNALMIAIAGYFNNKPTKDYDTLKANGNLKL
ncbi:MAG: tRNA (adenosine(37)-N6)-threonylcarbamoyltransferase complex transferase subunit TsaD [Candidatus Nomurabacteria bacterium]|nr:tRNA (adenosine(37)-N6)-threonylcarbamoyltransferase complex transferase subunit TsaD [Candidatus Nomurabacteria bacterium]